MVSLKASFVLSFFPLDVLDEIWDLIESVSEGFLTYSFTICTVNLPLFILSSSPIKLFQTTKIMKKVIIIKHNSYSVNK